MKTELWVLLGIAGYFLYSRNQPGSYGGPYSGPGPTRYPPSTTYPGGSSRSTGSGGTTASGPGVSGGSFTNPPVGGSPGNNAWADPSGYFTCPDGTLVNDPSLCLADPSTYIRCNDGTLVNDASLCPENQGYVDTGDPCDINSWAYDVATCSGMTAGYL